MLPIRRKINNITTTVTSHLSKARNSFDEMDSKNKIIIMIIIICACILINILYNYFFNYKNENETRYNVKYFKEGKNCLNNPVIYKNDKLDITGEGGQFTYSVWVKIDDWYSNYGEWKTIFRKGSKTDKNLLDWCSYSEQSPGIYLGNKVNNLLVVMTTTDYKGIRLEKCNINNIPIKEWVLITLVVNNNKLEIYLNAKLEKTCVYKGTIKNNNGVLNVNSPIGFNGLLANLEYFNVALQQNEIYKLLEDRPTFDKLDNQFDTNICASGNNDKKIKDMDLKNVLQITKGKFKDKL